MALRLETPAWFSQPERAFRASAFWFWHHLPTEAEISARLAEIAVSGLGTIMIQARLALPLETYLSPAYLAACRFASAEAARLGLGVEIYDEYNWMSGHGGGRTVSGADYLRERHLFWTGAILATDGTAELVIEDIRSPFLEFLGQDGLDWCYEGGAPRFDEWTVVAAIASDEAGHHDITDAARITAGGDMGCRVAVAVEAEAGRRVMVFVSARCRTSRLINYLLPEAAERFAEKVYAPLVEAGGDAARSIFFDHPYAGFYVWKGLAGDFGNSLLWDAALPCSLPQAPLGLQLLSLVEDVGPRTARLRTQFLEAYSARLHEAFFGTLHRWCDARGLDFTGHELLTHVGSWNLHDGLGGIDPRSMPGVDYFAVDAYRTATSVDAADYAPQLSAKLGDSVARANGRSRCTIEQYSTGRETGMPGGAGQWGLTLERLRAQAIRHTLFGARRILLHALYLDDGFASGTRPGPNPRFDFAPGFNLQPWWQDAPPVFDELARLSAFLEDGVPIRPVALLYPLETIRAEAMAPDCGRHFGWWAKALSEAGIGFDIVDEAMVAAGEISNGCLQLPSGRYTTLILPAVTTLASRGTAEHLRRFTDAGGSVLASGGLPWKTKAEGEDPAMSAILRGVVKETVPGDEAAVRRVVESLPRGMLWFVDGPSWTTATRCGDALRLATVNDTDQWRVVELDLPEPGRIVRWLPHTGERSLLADSSGRLRIDLAPHALLCLEVEPGRVDASSPPAIGARRMPEPADISEPRVLADGWTFRTGDAPFQPIATDRGWECQGFATFAGTGCYRITVEVPPCQEGLDWHLVLPGLRDTVTCFADGIEIGRSVAGEAAFALPAGQVAIDLAIRNTAANRYYPGSLYAEAARQPSGLLAPPRLEARPSGAGDLRILPNHEA